MARLYVQFDEGTPHETMLKVIADNECVVVYEMPQQPPTFIVSAPDGQEAACADRFNSMSSVRVQAFGDIQFQTFK